MKFSERIGVSAPQPLQTDSISEDLRNRIWNFLVQYCFKYGENWERPLKLIFAEHYKQRIDEFDYYYNRALYQVSTLYFDKNISWYEPYDLLEFVCDRLGIFGISNRAWFCDQINRILTEENSGFRFIGGKLCPITNKAEIEEIGKALLAKNKDVTFGVREHIQTALELLSQKPTPDYRNCIKESISAVESVVKIISQDDNATLSQALKKLDEDFPMHGSLREGLIKLYGYTSDEGGIRHAMLAESNIGFDEAKFMLVTCSAFVNYLISKADSLKLI